MRALRILVTAVVCGAIVKTSPQASAAGPHLNVGHKLRASETSAIGGQAAQYRVQDRELGRLWNGTNEYGTSWWATSTTWPGAGVQPMPTVLRNGEGLRAASRASAATGRLRQRQQLRSARGQARSRSSARSMADTRRTFTGTFNPGGNRTKGSIGTFDHDCDASDASGDCDGPASPDGSGSTSPASRVSTSTSGGVGSIAPAERHLGQRDRRQRRQHHG